MLLPLAMKFRLCIVASIVLLPIAVTLSAPSSADYQAAIREATENYRGDLTEGIVVIRREYFHSGSFNRDITDKYLRTFAEFPFTLSLLSRFTSNQTMKLTATAPCFDHAFDNDSPSIVYWFGLQ